MYIDREQPGTFSMISETNRKMAKESRREGESTDNDRPEDTTRLSEVSARIGANWLINQGPGGNTSLKCGEFMWVKASGTRLDRALHEQIFTRVRLAPELSEGWTETTGGTGNARKPSIETSLHAAIPHKAVIHTHPIEVIATSILENARDELDKRLEGFNWRLAEYARPGEPLHQEVKRKLDSSEVNVIVLQNHGLITCGESLEEAEKLTYEVNEALKQDRREAKEVNISELNKLIERNEGCRLPEKSIIHSLASDDWCFDISKRNAYSPDHAVFRGTKQDTENSFRPEEIRFREYSIIQGIGVALFPECSASTEEALQAQAEVYLRIPPQTSVKLLSDDQCAEITNWDAEKLRLQMNS